MSASPLPLDAIRQPAILWSVDGRIAGANDLVETLAGRPLAGCTAADLIAAVAARAPGGALLAPGELPASRALGGEEEVRVPLAITAADGAPAQVFATASPIREGGRVAGALECWQTAAPPAASEERVRARSAAMGEGFFLFELREDGAGRPAGAVFLDATPAFEHLAGVPAGGLAGRDVAELLPGLAARQLERGADPAGDGVPWRFEESSPALGRPVEVRVFSLGDGRRCGAVVSDVTGRRRAEEALQRERDFSASVMSTAAALIVVLDREGRIVRFNGTCERLTGYTFEEVRTIPVWDLLVPPDEAGLVREVFRELLGGRFPCVHENHWLTKDGDRRLIRWANTVLADASGGGDYAIGIGTDVTAARQAEAALRESEERYRALFASLDVGFCLQEILFDDDGRAADCRFLETNRAFVKQTGLADAVGRTIREMAPGLEEHWLEVYGEIVRTGEPRRFIQTGEPLAGWYEIDAHPVGRPGANQVAVLLTDITGPMRSDEALRSYAEELRRSNEDLERFAYVASHDLQEPLRSIVSFSQLLEKRYRGRLGRDADEYIDFIVEGGVRMQALILDLLAYSRVNTTRQQIGRTEAEDVMHAVERHLDARLREAGAVLTHDGMPAVMADPLQLEQVLEILVLNAIKFCRPEEPARVHVGARRFDGFWEFSVEDNGIGIEEEYFEKIFVIFQRLHTKDRYEGTGIGLPIVKRIVDRHGGTVRVESVPGEGTTFFFTLPAA